MNKMEQDVDNTYRTVCSTCLSADRNLFAINNLAQIYQVFRLLMYDFAGDRFGDTLEMEQFVCWECLALLKKFCRFKQQVHSAQDHLRVFAISRAQESVDHTYMSQSLSSLDVITKADYDKIYFDYTARDAEQWPTEYIAISGPDNVKNEQFDVTQAVRSNIDLDIDDHMLEVPQIVLENPVTGVMSHIVVGTDALVTHAETFTHVVKGEVPITVSTITETDSGAKKPKPQAKVGYVTEYMSEAEMMACREEAKQKLQYASSVYKCELCIIGFYTQQQVEDHFISAHRAKPGFMACKVCYVYIDESKIHSHLDEHYFRYTCKMCSHVEFSVRLISMHVKTHMSKAVPNTVIKIGDTTGGKSKKKKQKESPSTPPKPGDLRRLLSKTTIEGYRCLECDMFFKNSRARKNHVDRYHREGLQCDHCKKRFVNKTTLATHLRLHEGPLPREECPICHKMVRVIQLKYHIQRHENKTRHVCFECDKVFSHQATYHAHLKYSRAHASDNVFKFPCPMCNKGYPTKEQMQDHFNYQHLGKTTHKCPICAKPIASRANVEKHMMRVHGERKEKPRNHCCQQCGKAFTDKKALVQHIVIHSGERPLSCEICQQTFKQKASLYTHRKRVHKVFPPKRVVEFMDSKPDGS
ncbi:zinc finger protein 425-like [Pectinophora gossypiella]|uniref:zinc finger protein 425-like n=1 Tax=Pectinophora gossypiella TaxID=13191 RepID=UPI00214E708E|nr:zinc finger protein 425-like [Pectinophora gossypiella]